MRSLEHLSSHFTLWSVRGSLRSLYLLYLYCLVLLDKNTLQEVTRVQRREKTHEKNTSKTSCSNSRRCDYWTNFKNTYHKTKSKHKKKRIPVTSYWSTFVVCWRFAFSKCSTVSLQSPFFTPRKTSCDLHTCTHGCNGIIMDEIRERQIGPASVSVCLSVCSKAVRAPELFLFYFPKIKTNNRKKNRAKPITDRNATRQCPFGFRANSTIIMQNKKRTTRSEKKKKETFKKKETI